MKQKILLFLSGMGMGAADLVPGISGGTVAFILGIYEKLIQSVKTPLKSIPFLATLLSGMVLSIILFSRGIHQVLQDPYYSKVLFSAFVGLVLGSLYFIVKKIPKWKLDHYIAFVIGAAIAYLSSQPVAAAGGIVQEHNPFWIFLCGALGISAMLLPGISGSYLLLVLGMYEPAIHSLVKFIDSLFQGNFDFESFKFLFLLGMGILSGALLFSRVIAWLLKNYHNRTIALLSGFMVGAMRVIWPFDTLVPEAVATNFLFVFVASASFLTVLALEVAVERAKR